MITFGPFAEDDGNTNLYTDNFPFLMENEDGMTLFSSMRSMQFAEPHEYGDEAIKEWLTEELFHPELIRILAYARRQGFNYVMIDRDCTETLPAGE